MMPEIPKSWLADEALRLIETADFNGSGWMRINEICKALDLNIRMPMKDLIVKLQEIAE